MMRKTIGPASVFFIAAGFLLFDFIERPFLALRDQWMTQSLQNAPCIVVTHYPAESPDNTVCPLIKVKYANTKLPAESLIRLPCVSNKDQLTFLQENYPIGKSLTCWYQNIKYSTLQEQDSKYSVINPPLTKFDRSRIVAGCILICLGLITLFFTKKKLTVTTPTEPAAKEPLQILQKKPVWQNLIFLAVGILCLFLSYRLFQREWYVVKHFQEASCTVLDKKMIDTTTSSSKRKTSKTIFYLTYKINQTIYREWRAPTLTESYDNLPVSFGQTYQSGMNYPCWYDPNDPKVVVLERGNFTFVLFVFGMSIIFIVSSVVPLIIRKKKN